MDKNADSVVICKSAESHSEIAIAALRHDKNVFIQKPISDNLESASAIIAAAGKSKGKFFVGYILRCNIR